MNFQKKIQKPDFMDSVIEYCEILSKGIPYVRVDGYVIGGKWLFGEMTFYTWNGFMEFSPKEWDIRLGQWIKLPKFEND